MNAIKTALIGTLAGSAMAIGTVVATAEPAAAATPAHNGNTIGATIAGANVGVHVVPTGRAADAACWDYSTVECVVDGPVNIRTGPGTGYASLGLAYAGTPVTVHCWASGDGRGWYNLDIWGGQANVWIAEDFISHLWGHPNC